MIIEKSAFQGQNVLITGVCGTVGKELLKQVNLQSPKKVIGIDHNEAEVFFLGVEYSKQPNVHIFLADLRDFSKICRTMQGIDIVLHAGALKHVFVCENDPSEAIQTNIMGTQHVIDAALANGVSKVLLTSTDKAVNPTNVMGTSKLMCERLMTASNAHRRDGDPIFFSTRFGNVLGSSGSVIPVFQNQIANGGPLTVTDSLMTRFIMTLEDAVSLVIQTLSLARGGEVFVTKMPVIKIIDLAEVMVEDLAPKYNFDAKDIEIEQIGALAGEKLYEELLSHEETRRTVETKNFFAVLPAFQSLYEKIDYNGLGNPLPEEFFEYNSSIEKPMSKQELRLYLQKFGLMKANNT